MTLKTKVLQRLRGWYDAGDNPKRAPVDQLALLRNAVAQSGLPHYVAFKTDAGASATLLCAKGRLYNVEMTLPDRDPIAMAFPRKPKASVLRSLAAELSVFAESGNLAEPAFSAAQDLKPRGGITPDAIVYLARDDRAAKDKTLAGKPTPSKAKKQEPKSKSTAKKPAATKTAAKRPSKSAKKKTSKDQTHGVADPNYVSGIIAKTKALHLAFQDSSPDGEKTGEKTMGTPILSDSAAAGFAKWHAQIAPELGTSVTVFLLPKLPHGECVALVASGKTQVAAAFPKNGLVRFVRAAAG